MVHMPPLLLAPRKIARHLLVLAIVGGCVVAGFWQLSRLHWQNGFDARVAMRLPVPTVPLTSLIGRGSAPNPDAVTYRRVEVSGVYDPAHETVLVARTLNEQNGNHVLTPLVLADGRAIVVDRGWVPFDLQLPPTWEQVTPYETISGVEARVNPPEVYASPADLPRSIVKRSLMTEPDLILLDEPFAGVNPVMENKLVDLVHALLDQGKTFLITDHEMRLIMGLCERVLVLDYGELIAEGTPQEIQRNERVIEAYFGRGRESFAEPGGEPG